MDCEADSGDFPLLQVQNANYVLVSFAPASHRRTIFWLSRPSSIFPGQAQCINPCHPTGLIHILTLMRQSLIWNLCRIGWLITMTCNCIAAAPSGEVDFNRDVRPILSDKCYFCHGPDEKARKAKLRLDTREGVFRIKEGKAVVTPGKSSESELIRRITADDPDDHMPPVDSNRTLTALQIETLKRWVDQGAKWKSHWAFVPPRRAEPPAVHQSDWPINSIDRFILARLEAENLRPSPEARKDTLLRRVTFDLTGLPPTTQELDAFLADPDSNAYEKVVDRLLASPRYGERMAVQWLDIARYADTHGYQMDRYRAVWPYRDWVIKAFNQNEPFDQFATDQIAGDLLPNATKDQKLATAFNRLHMQSEEGGIVEEEYRVAYVVDRVNTFGTAFLGLTTECCRCHDHKFDPLTQKDFYSLFSFFQNIDESGQTVYFGDVMPVPTLILSDKVTDEKASALDSRIADQQSILSRIVESATTRAAFDSWLANKGSLDATNMNSPLPGMEGSFSFNEIISNRVSNLANSAKPANPVEGPKLVSGKFGLAAELSGENGFSFPGIGNFTRSDSFSFSLWLKDQDRSARAVVFHHSRAPIDAGSRGYEMLLENGRIAFGLHHMWPGNSLKIVSKELLPTNEWTHVAVSYDGSSRASGLRLYINGSLAPVEVIRDGLYKDITYDGDEPELEMGYRFRDSGFKNGRVDEFRVFKRILSSLEVTLLSGHSEFVDTWNTPVENLSTIQRKALFDYFCDQVYPPAIEMSGLLQMVRKERSDLTEHIPEMMVMKEMSKPKPAFVLKRGGYDAHGEQVYANTPGILPPFPLGQPTNRLGLARWLTDPEHPLTARVTVNRAWQMMFGKGIVETSDNFGSQGAQPSDPELLDWLALNFTDTGWDTKRLLKQIALSATYRQSSHADDRLLALDPANNLLGRGPERRLTAEMLRDQALSASGLLVEKLGGPSVKPYQPEGLWEEIAMGAPHYNQGHGDDLHRRSLYTFWKRTVPPPVMITFDSASRNVCTARRQETSTPLQALALLNDTQIIEASRLVSEKMLKLANSNLDDEVAWAFRIITSRNPRPNEQLILKQLFNEQREIFAADPLAAAKVEKIGEVKNSEGLNPADLAAGTVLAEAIFNHDDAVMRR